MREKVGRSLCRGWEFLCFAGNSWGRGAGSAGQVRVQGPWPVQEQLQWQGNMSAVAHLWKAQHWKCSDLLVSGVFSLGASLVPASAAGRAQDEDGAEGSAGRTDTSSSVSITNSISSCEVTKIVRMPLACLQPSLLMWFRACTAQY